MPSPSRARKRSFTALIASLACLATMPPAHAQDLNPVRSGWFGAAGRSANSASPANENYFVGIGIGLSGPETTRNFFVFDLTGITSPILSATLILYNPIAPPDSFNGYNSPDATERYQLTSTSASPAQLQGTYLNADPTGQAIYATLGTGVVFGEYTASAADNGAFLQIPFTPAGVAALSGATGSLIGFGGQLTTLVGDADQSLFGGTNPTGMNLLNATPPIVLRLVTGGTAAPEPSTVALFVPALILVGGFARRGRRT